jgi:antitoxin ParD1/3/4
MTVSVDLGKQLEDFMASLVASGRYGSMSDVLRAGVEMVQQRELDLAGFDAKIEEGLADVDAGRTRAIEDVSERLIAKYRAMAG